MAKKISEKKINELIKHISEYVKTNEDKLINLSEIIDGAYTEES